eukprot:CAMPEP_0115177574 /NCGR_PEP_ID=MMETSP0270-20121206/5450_1 /TAXON_ID=71861 /ORGANISM="Scrippsiella trochoidea, Strain CCMP3099" /LENGTH=111 /DNA_ID=CAMNT_0002590499 /DNA_START=729 /DNA_END=1060 /DNA_ORIENTATION=-
MEVLKNLHRYKARVSVGLTLPDFAETATAKDLVDLQNTWHGPYKICIGMLLADGITIYCDLNWQPSTSPPHQRPCSNHRNIQWKPSHENAGHTPAEVSRIFCGAAEDACEA